MVNTKRNYSLPGPSFHRLIAPALPGAFHLFDHLVGAAEQSDRESKAKRLGSFEIDRELGPRGLPGRSAGLSPLRIRPVYKPAKRYASVLLAP
jgi:hypothetical protein